jgi:hypothetical protein
MSSGGSKATSSNTTSTTPWGPAQPFLQNAMGKANDWLNSDASKSIYQGTTVIPFSQNTLQGMGQTAGVANNAMTPMQNPLKSYTGMFDILNPIARGDFANDTTFGNTLGAAQEAASTSVNDAMSAAGRYGSGVHQGTMAKSIGDLTNQAMLDRQNWALGGLQSLGDRMPGAYNTALAPAQTMMGLGGMQEDMAGKYAQEGMDKFNAAKQAPIDAIAQANAIFTGSGALGSNQSQKVYQPTQWGQIGANAVGSALTGKG